ncbi:hypothetical protein D3C72_2093760 [compost metagenome]
MPITTSGLRRAMKRRMAKKLASILKPPLTVCARPLPRMPENAMASMGMPLFGTRSCSMPWVVPSQLTSQPRARIVCAIARPGKIWPPVPAAMIISLFVVFKFVTLFIAGLRA